MHKLTRWEWAVTKMSNVNLDLLGWLNQLVLFTSLLNLGQCWTLGKQLRSIRISSGFRKDSSRSSISSGSSWNAFFSFTEELCFPVSNFDEDFIFCLVSCVWTWSSSTWTIFSSFRMFWMLLLLLECAMVTKLCCFCCRPQSTRHLAHLFTVRTIAINSIENVESKCACTLVTGTHKCFNIFTPTSHCVAYIPSNIPHIISYHTSLANQVNSLNSSQSTQVL